MLGIFAATAHSQKVFAFLVNASGALMVFIYMMIVVAHLRVRRRREASGVPAPALTMWFFPWADYLALGGMAAVLIAMALTPDMQQDLKASVLSFAVALGAFYFVNSRRRSRALESPASAG